MQKTILDTTYADAGFSACRTYRYDLIRGWDVDKPVCLFIGLNPSTADETENDPTIRRCITYARDWGYGTMVMCNLFALRATEPENMRKSTWPVSEYAKPAWNNKVINQWSCKAGLVLCAWGNHGTWQRRGWRVFQMIKNSCKPHCLGINKNGQPVHPLYQPKNAQPQPLTL